MSHSFPRAGRLKEPVGIVGWLMLLEAGSFVRKTLLRKNEIEFEELLEVCFRSIQINEKYK